jgi:photosystem II stability/assembly factor-like uncharacterized protein
MNAFTNNPPTGGIYEIGQRYNIVGFIAVNGLSFGVAIRVFEQYGRAVITFFRMYGTYAAIGFNYATQNGTAIAGVDYTAVSGELVWAQGDKDPKSVTIPILTTSAVTSSSFSLVVSARNRFTQVPFSFYNVFVGGDINTFPNPPSFQQVNPVSIPITIVRQGNGELDFSGTPYSVQRPGGTTTVTLQVNRISGFKGAVGCSFHTTDGTAVSGVAYTGQTGTLSWAANEGGPKNITITILSGGSGTQSFTVTIDTPTGGVSIGATNVATVNIVAAAPPANPTSPGGIPDQIVDLEAYANPNGDLPFQPASIVTADNQCLQNRNVLINSYATSGIRPNMNAVFFITTTTGWAVGDGGMVFKTTDGGVTWTQQTSGVVTNLYDVFFSDSTHGWAVGAAGTIIATTNGGTTWATQTSGVSTDLNAVYFISNTNGWAVGDSGVILVTTNGGGTWTPQTSGVVTNLNDVYFVDSTHGWAVGDGGVILFYNGTTWVAQTSGTVENLNGVSFTDSSHGWAVGDNGTVLFWNGSTWTPQVSGTTQDLNEIDMASSTVGWIVGDNGTILVTANGTTWTPQSSGTTENLTGVSAPSTTVVYVVGEDGTILGTTTAGSAWAPENVPLPIGSSGGNGGSWGGGDDYANYDQTFSQTGFLRFQGSQY